MFWLIRFFYAHGIETETDLGKLFNGINNQQRQEMHNVISAESGIGGHSPPIMSHINSISNCLSLKGGSPVAIKCIIIPKEYTSDF